MMLSMENASRFSQAPQNHPSYRNTARGYELSDTESEWQESPWHDELVDTDMPNAPYPARTISHFKLNQGDVNVERNIVVGSRISSTIKRHRRSPYKPSREGRQSKSPHRPSRGGHNGVSEAQSDQRRKAAPSTSEHHKYVSPYRGSRKGLIYETTQLNGSFKKHFSLYEAGREESDNNLHGDPFRKHVSPFKGRKVEPEYENSESLGSGRNQNLKNLRFRNSFSKESYSSSLVSENSSYSHEGSSSAPKPRVREIEKEQQPVSGSAVQIVSRSFPQSPNIMSCERTDSTYSSNCSEHMVISNDRKAEPPSSYGKMMQTMESISHDVFYSCNHTAQMKDFSLEENQEKKSVPPHLLSPEKGEILNQSNSLSGGFNLAAKSASTRALSQTSMRSSSNITKLRSSSGDNDSKPGYSSSKAYKNSKKSSDNKQKCQNNTWFLCMTPKSCRKSTSLDSRASREASLIEKAFVVEELRLFWADQHRPRSLDGFICHTKQAQHLKKLISYDSCPHILFKGPPGLGKKSMALALLHEIFGDFSSNISYDLRQFCIKETTEKDIVVPLISSPHHVELNLKSEAKYGKYILMALAKEIANNHAVNPEFSEAGFKEDFKVIVLYDIDKVSENLQHLIKWIMDGYMDACKIIMCCEDETHIHDTVKSRCKVVGIDSPATHEVIDVLKQVAEKENVNLSLNFAARIAMESKKNLRRAIMALEACRAHNYPFVDDQPIPLGWEEVLVELAAEILADPSTTRLSLTRQKLEKLLQESVHPKLILQKLVEQFLRGVEANIRREIYYWHAYYEKRLPSAGNALLKLEEFVAKFMSIRRKSIPSKHAAVERGP